MRDSEAKAIEAAIEREERWFESQRDVIPEDVTRASFERMQHAGRRDGLREALEIAKAEEKHASGIPWAQIEADAYGRLLDLLRDRLIAAEADIESLKRCNELAASVAGRHDDDIKHFNQMREDMSAIRVLDRLNALEEHARSATGKRK